MYRNNLAFTESSTWNTVKHWRIAAPPVCPMRASRCYAEKHYWGANGKGADMGNANTYDGRTIADSFELLEFVS